MEVEDSKDWDFLFSPYLDLFGKWERENWNIGDYSYSEDWLNLLFQNSARMEIAPTY